MSGWFTDPPYSSIDRNKAGFSAKVGAVITWLLSTFFSELVAFSESLNLISTTGSSSSSVAIGPGPLNFIASTGKSWTGGMWVVIADTAAPGTNYVAGPVISYNGSTGALSINSVLQVGGGTKAAWTISQSAPGGATLGSNSFTGDQTIQSNADLILLPGSAIRESLSSITTSASPDIWLDKSNQVLVTDAAVVVTGFVAAPQAGAKRTLIAGAAFSITAGANVIIQGWASGQTYKLAVNDQLDVIALTTTQFLVTIRRANGADIKDIGELFDWADDSDPAHGLVATGAAVSRTTYANLFARIGTLHGAGDGSTTFNLPNIPADYTTVQANANDGSATVGQVIAHSHAGAQRSGQLSVSGSSNYDVSSVTSTGSTGGSANLAAGLRVRKCIRF